MSTESEGTIPNLLTGQEVADIFRISLTTVWRWGEQGRIPVIQGGEKGNRRYLFNDIKALIESARFVTEEMLESYPTASVIDDDSSELFIKIEDGWYGSDGGPYTPEDMMRRDNNKFQILRYGKRSEIPFKK